MTDLFPTLPADPEIVQTTLRLAAEVRAAQKAYFKSRDRSALATSKRLESDLDRKLKEVLPADELADIYRKYGQ